MNNETISSKIKEAIELTQDIEEPYKSIAFEVILNKMLDRETMPAEASKGAATQLTSIHVQANEFLASLDTKSQLDLFEAVAYYFLRSKGEGVTRTEFLETLSKARLPRPKNISDVIGKCIRRGHIIESNEDKDGQKSYQITPSGEKYIEERIKPQ